jgi:hypothetical protein
VKTTTASRVRPTAAAGADATASETGVTRVSVPA